MTPWPAAHLPSRLDSNLTPALGCAQDLGAGRPAENAKVAWSTSPPHYLADRIPVARGDAAAELLLEKGH